MNTFINRLWRNRKGAAVVEFAVTMPLVMIVTFGAADYGRLFMETSVIATASGAGAVYAYRSTKEASDLSGAEAAVLNNVNGLESVSADVTKLCDCPASPGAWVSCSTTCTGYGSPRIYIRSKASKSFDTFGKYPGVPDQVNLGVSTWMRVQ
jgi:Flp pilus assembly protein TadG